MIINLTSANFTLESGSYYSAPFRIDSSDTLVTVAMYLADTGTTSLQNSLNETDWADIPDSSFVCNLFGLQTYSNADINLVFRTKSDQEPTEAHISI